MIRFMKFQNKNEKNQTAFGKWYARAVCDETVRHQGASRTHGQPQHPLTPQAPSTAC